MALTGGLTALVALLTAPVALLAGNIRPAGVMLAVAACGSAIAGAAHRWLPAGVDRSETQRLASVAAMWLVFVATAGVTTWIAVLSAENAAGATPLRDPLSALFAAASGASTTGLSVLIDPATADPWLQWWRSLLQWFGALGIVVFAVLIAEPSGDRDSLIDDEWGTLPADNATAAAQRVLTILTALTAVAIAGLIVAGDPLWRAVNHGVTAAATGGFVITSESAGSSGPASQVVLVVVVLVSAMSFGTIWDTVRRTGTALWRRTQVRTAAALTTTGIVASIAVADDEPIGGLVFNSISASTTAGFSVGSGHQSIDAIAALAMFSMLIGGAAGSTAGGIKVARFAWLAKAVRRWLPRGTRHDDHAPHRWDAEDVAAPAARHRVFGAAAITSTWIATLFVGTVVIAAANPTSTVGSVAFEAISATSGVGLTSGLTDALLDGVSKSTLIALMVVGRIEITAVIVLLLHPGCCRPATTDVGPDHRGTESVSILDHRSDRVVDRSVPVAAEAERSVGEE